MDAAATVYHLNGGSSRQLAREPRGKKPPAPAERGPVGGAAGSIFFTSLGFILREITWCAVPLSYRVVLYVPSQKAGNGVTASNDVDSR